MRNPITLIAVIAAIGSGACSKRSESENAAETASLARVETDGGGAQNGGEILELSFPAMMLKIHVYLQTAAGRNKFPEVNPADFLRTIENTDITIVDFDLYDRHGYKRTCLNYDGGPRFLIRCNREKIEFWQSITPAFFGILFHEYLNLMQLELTDVEPNRDNPSNPLPPSLYPIASRILSIYEVVGAAYYAPPERREAPSLKLVKSFFEKKTGYNCSFRERQFADDLELSCWHGHSNLSKYFKSVRFFSIFDDKPRKVIGHLNPIRVHRIGIQSFENWQDILDTAYAWDYGIFALEGTKHQLQRGAPAFIDDWFEALCDYYGFRKTRAKPAHWISITETKQTRFLNHQHNPPSKNLETSESLIVMEERNVYDQANGFYLYMTVMYRLVDGRQMNPDVHRLTFEDGREFKSSAFLLPVEIEWRVRLAP